MAAPHAAAPHAAAPHAAAPRPAEPRVLLPRPATPRPWSRLLVLVLAGLVAAGCVAAQTPPASGTGTPGPGASALVTPTASPPVSSVPGASFPVTLTDDEGNRVAIAAPPRAIVSLTPAATETLYVLGLGDRLVGKVEDISLYPPAAAAVPDVAKFGSVDVERIVALKADLVIAGGNGFNPPDQVARLRSLGIPVLTIYGPRLDAALADFGLIGQAVGRTAEAAALVARLRDAFAAVQAATRNLPQPRVYYELDASNGYFGPAPDYFGVEMIQLAGGMPLTSGAPGAFQIPEEKIIAFDPEVILLGDAAYGVTADQVAARPGWAALSAVKNHAIRPVDDVIITRPGPRLGDGLVALARAIHPEASLPAALVTPLASGSPGP